MGRDGGDADQEKRGGIWEKRGRASAAVAQAERVAQRTATARADILENFEFRNQIPRLSKADALGTLIEKLTSPDVNLSPAPVKHADGWVRYPGLDNHGMGSIFEELVRRFNEENNKEAGEHWTPRDAVRLMAKLVFLPVADELKSGTYLLYDGACGTGGMLTVAEETLGQLTAERGKDVSTHLFGQEINAETYAICTADLLLKGEGEAADNIVGGPEHSTLANDAFPSREFDFMLSNPPYGKSWKTDLERMGGKKDMRDPRFVIEHAGDPEYSLVTRSSDGQMLFLANKLSKMKQDTPLGSRIAEVHNGSSLFTGDAGQGESNIRRWIIENDWLEAIVALPLNMFYNTGIATYVWVLTNRKPEHRRGKVQLIDATKWCRPLRKNFGKKNCELAEDDIARICNVFLAFEETDESRIFDNAAFGYWKVTVERPLRIEAADPNRVYKAAEIKALKETGKRSEDAPPVLRKIHKRGTEADPLRGLFAANVNGRPAVVRLKNVAGLVMGQSPSSEDCSTARIGLPFIQGCAEFGSDHPEPVQFCLAPAKVSPAGAILLSVRAPVGRLNVADQRYGIGRGLCAVVPRPSFLDATFCRYSLGSSTVGLTLQSTGSTYDAVSVGDVACLRTVVPSIPEQAAIVRFLDHADRRIRRYIRAQQQLIALLAEQKQAVIHQAVTRGPRVLCRPRSACRVPARDPTRGGRVAGAGRGQSDAAQVPGAAAGRNHEARHHRRAAPRPQARRARPGHLLRYSVTRERAIAAALRAEPLHRRPAASLQPRRHPTGARHRALHQRPAGLHVRAEEQPHQADR